MKNNLLVFILSLTTCLHLTAQKVAVSWGEEDKNSVYGPNLAHIIKGQGDEIITLQVKGNLLGAKATPTFTRFDPHWNVLLSKDPFNGNSKMGIYTVQQFKDSLFLLTRAWQSNAQMYTLQAYPIDRVTLEAGAPRDLVSFDSRHKRINAILTIGKSNDNNLAFLFASEPYDLDEDRKYYLGVWDNKFNKQWERTTTLPYPSKFVIPKGQVVSNQGDVYLACRQYEKEIINNPLQGTIDNTSSYQYKIFVYSKNDSTPREYTVDLQGKFVHEAVLHFDNSGNLIIAGLYKNNFAGAVTGSFLATLDKKTNQLTVNKMEDLPRGLVSRVSADDCGSSDANDPGLDPNFKWVGDNKRDDGTLDLLVEYKTASHHKSVNLALSSVQDEATYKAYDVVVVSFKPNGRIIYSYLPKKQEESPFWSHISISYMNHGNDLILFYNDSKKNVASQLSLSQQALDSLGTSVFVMATINGNGDMQWQVPFSNDDPDMMADILASHPIGTDALSLYIYKMRKLARTQYHLGLLTLQ